MKYLRVIKNPGEMLQSLRIMRGTEVKDNKYHLTLAGGWLLNAQSVNGDGGYSHSYSLLGGWAPSYPETTGYIIPTMLTMAQHTQEGRYETSALRAGEWLLRAQQADGSFLDLSGQRQIFDTGQIIEGLLELYGKSGKQGFLESAQKAGDFIVETQDLDGKWARFSYKRIPHTYYARVSANLLKLYKATKDEKYKASALKNLSWTLSQQRENGYFNYMGGKDELPFLHTIVYVLEGLLEGYKILQDENIFNSLKKTVDELVHINKERDFMLYSQYDENWNYPKKQKCMTGLAQWAGLLLDMYSMVKNEDYSAQAMKTIYYLKSKQITRNGNIKGAISGSIPLWGRYFPFAFNNWTVKFFADAIMKSENILKRGRK